VEVCVDETPVGCFVEIEGSKDSIQHIAQEMGLSRDQFINKDYVELYQQREP
jgi:adenylate cyclase class IV